MSKGLFSVALGVSLVLAGCASHGAGQAQSRSQAGKTKAVLVGDGNAAKPGDRLLCFKRSRAGSHISRIYCITQKQYEELKQREAKSSDNLDDAVRHAKSPRSCNPNQPPGCN